MSGFSKLKLVASGCRELIPNEDGSINVVIVEGEPGGGTGIPTDVKSIFATVGSVAIGATALLLQYTVPVGKSFFLQRIEVGGDNIATYEFTVNGILEGRHRTYFSGPLSGVFDFSSEPQKGVEYAGGTILRVFVKNFRPSIGEFEARIQGILQG